MKKSIVILWILLLAFPALAVRVELQLQSGNRSGTIEEGQPFYIIITVHDMHDAPQSPANVPGAKIQYFAHRGSSSSFTSVNGQTTQSFSNSYAVTLKAEKAGKYTFGPVTVGGVKSNQISYQIVKPGSNTQSPGINATTQGGNAGAPGAATQGASNGPTFIGNGNEQLFLRANISKTTAYEQEALVYTVKLYTTYNSIKFIGATEAPKFDGFVIEESNAISNQLEYENYKGRTYATAVIARYIVFPQITGQLKITGNKYTVSADAEEYYHDPFYQTLTVRKPVQLNVTPNDLTINVNALPSPRPANFSGGVGKFTISSNLKSDNAIANQAGSITYIVSGEGNLKYVNLPDLNALYPPEIEVFTPTTDVNAKVGTSNVSGTVKFDYGFTPMEAGTFTLPHVQLCYFNPECGKYETSESRSYVLTVAPGSESAKSQTSLKYDASNMPVSVPSGQSSLPLITEFSYWIWYVIAILILIGAVAMSRKYEAMMADVASYNRRRAGKMARKRLKKASEMLRQKNESGFYSEILKALWGYLGDKLHLPTSELNRENISNLLETHGIDASLIQSLIQLLDECEFARYSSQKGEGDMQQVYSKTADLINNLEDAFAKCSKVAKSKYQPEAGNGPDADIMTDNDGYQQK